MFHALPQRISSSPRAVLKVRTPRPGCDIKRQQATSGGLLRSMKLTKAAQMSDPRYSSRVRRTPGSCLIGGVVAPLVDPERGTAGVRRPLSLRNREGIQSPRHRLHQLLRRRHRAQVLVAFAHGRTRYGEAPGTVPISADLDTIRDLTTAPTVSRPRPSPDRCLTACRSRRSPRPCRANGTSLPQPVPLCASPAR